MYTDLPQRLRDLIDELVDIEVRIREVDNDAHEREYGNLTRDRAQICRTAFAYCKAQKLDRQMVNAAFLERLGRKVTDDGIV